MYKLPMSNLQDNTSSLPPGFRFHPTDEELIVYYLKNQAMSKPCPVSIIPEVDIYKFDPWQLPEKAEFGEKEWYFFTPRDRKYPNGVRPNRATVSGYWKATGTDKTIYSGSSNVGIKKALVFYKGRPPKGTKTDWIMHEYRLHDPSRPLLHQIKPHGSMRLDDWVLCRIYRKRHAARTPEMIIKPEEQTIIMEGINHDQFTTTPPMDHMFNATTETKINNVEATGYDQSSKFPRTFSLAHLCEFDYNLGSISNLFSSNANSTAASSTYDYQNQNNAVGTSGFDSVGSNQYLFADLVNKNNNPSSQAGGLMNLQLHSNPVYKFP